MRQTLCQLVRSDWSDWIHLNEIKHKRWTHLNVSKYYDLVCSGEWTFKWTQSLKAGPLWVEQAINNVVSLRQQTTPRWRMCAHINRQSQHINIAISKLEDNLYLFCDEASDREQTHSLLCFTRNHRRTDSSKAAHYHLYHSIINLIGLFHMVFQILHTPYKCSFLTLHVIY